MNDEERLASFKRGRMDGFVGGLVIGVFCTLAIVELIRGAS